MKPPFQKLSPSDQDAIRDALRAMAYGPFISDWELPIRCHVDRGEYRTILNQWPNLDDTKSESDFDRTTSTYYAINGAMNECCHAYEMELAPWEEWFTVTKEQLIAVYKRWKQFHGTSPSST
jgi:hypothetical protein